MRILVCGGRDYKDDRRVHEVLAKYFDKDMTIIEGGANGADRSAQNWAKLYNVKLETFPADWDKYGKRAGFIRNGQMLKEGKPDMVIAFPGGKGTEMMAMLAEKAGVKVVRIE